MRRLDDIGEEEVQRIKAELKEKKPKTVNNVLTVLSKLLKFAVKWRVIPAMPVQIELLRFDQLEVEFYEFEQYQQLVEAAGKLDRRAPLNVLLAGDAGLRTGEIIALEWTDIDFKRGLITVSKSEWKGQVTLPKGGRARRVPMNNPIKPEARRDLETILEMQQPVLEKKARLRSRLRDDPAGIRNPTTRRSATHRVVPASTVSSGSPTEKDPGAIHLVPCRPASSRRLTEQGRNKKPCSVWCSFAALFRQYDQSL